MFLLMGSGKSAESDWSALCSAPLENHYRECFQGSFWKRWIVCFLSYCRQYDGQRSTGAGSPVSADRKEYARLSQEEVSVIEKENGETLIAWEAELPYNSENLENRAGV